MNIHIESIHYSFPFFKRKYTTIQYISNHLRDFIPAILNILTKKSVIFVSTMLFKNFCNRLFI